MGIEFRKWYPYRVLRRIFHGWTPFVEDAVSGEELTLVMQQASIPSFGFFFMLALAACIATLGLIANSAPAIIGAMIIAPLMAPIMSLAFGIVLFERPLIVRSILTVIAGVVLVVGFAYVSTLLIGLRVTGSEILNRTAPTLLDLGVAVAAGGAAAFAYTRRSIINSIAGVAIAVALVPPLAVTGIGLALGGRASSETGLSLSEFGLYSGGSDIAAGSFLLFLTNFVGIVAFAILVFLSQKYGSWRKSLIGLAIFVFASVFLFEPLGNSFIALYVKSRTLRLMTKLQDEHPDIVSGQSRIDSIRVNVRKGIVYVSVEGFAPKDGMGQAQQRLDVFRAYLRAEIHRPLVIDVEFIPVDVVRMRSASKDVPKGMLNKEN